MKLLVISAAFPPARAGEAEHAVHLCEHLITRGIDVHVLTTKTKTQAGSYRFALHPIVRNWGWPDLPLLVSFLRRCSPDAVLLLYTPRDYNYNDMITFTPTITRAVLPHVRVVTQFLTGLIGPQGSILARAVRKGVTACVGTKTLDYVFGTLLCRSHRVITLSERHLAALLNHFPQLDGKGMVIPPPPLLQMCPENNGAARRRGREALGVKPEEFLIAYYGYLYKEKGVETLLTSLAMLNGKRNHTRLVMIGGNPGENHGSSYLDTIKQTAKSLGIADNIIWTGEYAPSSDEGSLYLRAADAGVFPFNYGVTLNRSSVAAAAAHGLPIVTTKGSDLEAAFVDGENVLLCPPYDANSVARAIESLISNPGLRQRLSAGALRLTEEWFSWEKALDRTVEALRA